MKPGPLSQEMRDAIEVLREHGYQYHGRKLLYGTWQLMLSTAPAVPGFCRPTCCWLPASVLHLATTLAAKK